MPNNEAKEFYKRCPVCGALPDTSSDGKSCWCSNSNCFAYTYYIPIEQWNNRPEEDKLYERINFLEETNGALNSCNNKYLKDTQIFLSRISRLRLRAQFAEKMVEELTFKTLDIVKLLNAILSITEDQKNIAEYYNGKSEKSD